MVYEEVRCAKHWRSIGAKSMYLIAGPGNNLQTEPKWCYKIEQ